MTNSAPHGQLKTPLSEEKRAYMDETMEEVARPASRAAHSQEPRHDATGTHRNAVVSAPLSAPLVRPERGLSQVDYHRQWRATIGREKFVASVRRWQDRNREKRRAHWAVGYALKTGRLIRGACERAGQECSGRIEAHHDDYSKPLVVRWFCKRHHKQADRERVATLQRAVVG
jgi:hypothetical protein